MVAGTGWGRRRERTTAMQTVDAMPSLIRSSPHVDREKLAACIRVLRVRPGVHVVR